ncbi:hypothetical protein D3C80_2030740 [compost metagenome]
MTATELTADRIPHQFEDLDALDVIHPVGSAHIAGQIFVDFRVIHVAHAGRQVNQAAGDVLFDDVLHLGVGHRRHHAVGLQRGGIR